MVKDTELKRQISKEKHLNQEKKCETGEWMTTERGQWYPARANWNIMKFQKEIKLVETADYDRQISKKEMKTEWMHQKLNKNTRTKQRLLEKAKKVKLKLQMTPEKTKTSPWINEKQMRQKLVTDETSQVRQCFWWPAEKQKLNDMSLTIITGNWFSIFYTAEIW